MAQRLGGARPLLVARSIGSPRPGRFTHTAALLMLGPRAVAVEKAVPDNGLLRQIYWGLQEVCGWASQTLEGSRPRRPCPSSRRRQTRVAFAAESVAASAGEPPRQVSSRSVVVNQLPTPKLCHTPASASEASRDGAAQFFFFFLLCP